MANPTVRSSPAAIPCESLLSFAMGAEWPTRRRVVVGAGWYGTNPANKCDLFTAYRWEESTGYVLLTYLNDASSDVCDPFGFCQDWLHQFELTAGVVVRF